MDTSSLELLEKSALPPVQARAILKAMDSEMAAREGVLATKADLTAAAHDLVVMIHGLELRIESVRTEMQKMGTKLVLWSFLFWVTGMGTLFSIFKWLK